MAMNTETMVLLALKQGNWRHAAETADKIAREDGDPLLRAVARAARRVESGDERSRSLLRFWCALRWEEKS